MESTWRFVNGLISHQNSKIFFHLKAVGLSILDSGLLNFRKWYFVCYMFYNSLQVGIWERASICGSPGQWLPIELSEVYDQGKSDYQGGWKACMANWRTRRFEGGCIQPWQFVILPSMVSASNYFLNSIARRINTGLSHLLAAVALIGPLLIWPWFFSNLMSSHPPT